MKELAELALNTVKSLGATYADIRFHDDRNENIGVKNGVVEVLENSNSIGFGIRVLYKGSWGFSASYKIDKETIGKKAREAFAVAKASSMVSKEDVVLSKEKAYTDSYKTPYKINPFDVSLDKKIEFLLEIDSLMRRVKGINVSEAEMSFYNKKVTFASTEGSYITQDIMEVGAGISAMAIKGNEVQTRSFPNSFKGQFQTGGYELLETFKLKENAERIAEEAVALLSAEQSPSGTKDLIIDSNQLALQVHESCGHPTELDRVFGMEASFAGTSFMTPEKLNELKYGSEVVNITADATTPLGLGTFGYDDEGVLAQKTSLIKNGLFVGYLTSRETASKLGQKSNGTMRADGWSRIPIIRMTNVNLESGTWEFDDLIKDTEDGIFISTNKEWSIDDKRLNFQFGCEVAYEIKNGKLGKMYKNPTYQGITPEFWNSCDAICNKTYWTVWGTPNCGKGEPMQIAHVSHGTAPSRFRNVKIGVGKW